MSYKVIHYFTDLQDFNHPYKVGDTFPHLGVKVSEERLKELSGKNNKQGKPLIQKVEEVKETDFSQFMNPPEEKAKVSYTKTDINRMSTSELRDFAKSNGVANAEDITGAELKKILIEMLNL